MKKFIYLLVDTSNNIVAAYDRLDVAEKMKSPIEELRKSPLEIKKQRINEDIRSIAERG